MKTKTQFSHNSKNGIYCLILKQVMPFHVITDVFQHFVQIFAGFASVRFSLKSSFAFCSPLLVSNVLSYMLQLSDCKRLFT